MSCPRIRHVAREIRKVVSQADFAGQLVQHYSIPAFDALGGPVLQGGNEIESDKLLVHRGDVLISKLNPRKSRVLLVGEVAGDVALSSTEFVGLRAESVRPRYLYWLLRSASARQALEAAVKSVTRSQQRCQPSDVLGVRVPLDYVRQAAVADFLDRECERLADLSRMIQEVKRVEAAVTKSAFDERTATWPRIRVRHLLTAIDQGWSPQCEEREPEPDEWGVLKLGCVNEDRFAYQAKALGFENEPRPDHTVGEGDVLMSRANTRELVGSCALVTSVLPPKTMLSDLLYRLTPDERRCTPEFLVVSLGASSARQQIEARATGSAGSMPKLSQAAIKQLTIPHGSLDEQNAVLDSLASELMPLTQLSRERGRLRTGLAEYRDALITEAVTGKLDVSRLSEQQMDEAAQAAMEGESPAVLSA